MATNPRTLTPIGLARLIERGIRANFSPGNRNAELQRLAELFADLAMSRAMDAEGEPSLAERRRATSDAHWLDAIADELDF